MSSSGPQASRTADTTNLQRSMSASTLLSEGRVSSFGFALPTRYTVEPHLITSRPAPVQMTKSASTATLPSSYSLSAFRMGSLVPDSAASRNDHALSQFADPHPSQVQLQLAEQQYNIRLSEWNRHVAFQNSNHGESKMRSKYRLIQEQRRAAADSNRHGQPRQQAWLASQKRIGYAARPRTQHEFTPGTFTTLANLSATDLAQVARQAAAQHRPPPQRKKVHAPAQQRRPPPPPPNPRQPTAAPDHVSLADVTAPGALTGAGAPVLMHRPAPSAPIAAAPRHRAPPSYDKLSVASISSAYLSAGSVAMPAPRPAPRAPPPPPAHRQPPRPPPKDEMPPPHRQPPWPPPREDVFDGEAMAQAIKERKRAQAEAQAMADQERKQRLSSPALKKDLLLIKGMFESKYKHLHDGFRKMNQTSHTKFRDSSKLTTDEFIKGLRGFGLPISQEHLEGITELMTGGKREISLADFTGVLKSVHSEYNATSRMGM